jgi:hypothetical protein
VGGDGKVKRSADDFRIAIAKARAKRIPQKPEGPVAKRPHIRTCRVCGEQFEAQGKREWCDNPACQEQERRWKKSVNDASRKRCAAGRRGRYDPAARRARWEREKKARGVV